MVLTGKRTFAHNVDGELNEGYANLHRSPSPNLEVALIEEVDQARRFAD